MLASGVIKGKIMKADVSALNASNREFMRLAEITACL
jgi:hypothetical protein